MTKGKLIRLSALMLFFIFGLAQVDGISGQTAPDLSPPQAGDRFVSGELKTSGLIGLSLAVIQDGRVTLARGYGISSLAERIPVDENTMFAVGSITKQFTSACILILAEEGKLDVADKVAKYYPGLTRAGDITLLDLMNHVSGYPDYYPLDFVDRRMMKEESVDEVIRRYGTAKLDFEPGTRYSYSNTGYLILGRVVEKVSGQPYGEFLSRRILSPVGMSRTVYEPEMRKPGFAQGYTSFALGPPEVALPEGKGWIAGAGGIFSTAHDLAIWDLALVGGKVLEPESLKLMLSPRRLADGRFSNYGCGLALGVRNGHQVLTHNGAVAGFFAQNLVIPATRSAVVLLTNLFPSTGAGFLFSRIVGSIVPPAPPAGVPAPDLGKKPSGPPAKPEVPKIAGLPAAEEAQAFFRRLQRADVDRSALGEEYSYFLTEKKIMGAAARLEPFGKPLKAEVESIGERGGMEVATVRLIFGPTVLKALMYRTPDGKIQQYFIQKG